MMIFRPWVGPLYPEGYRGKRILVVGESHYGDDEDLSQEITNDVIKRWCAVCTDKYPLKSLPFFSKIAALLTKRATAAEVSWGEYGDLYNRLAFCNFLHGFAGRSARETADYRDYQRSVEPYQKIVRTVAPQVLFVMNTRNLEEHLPDTGIREIRIQHPSSVGWSYAEWRSETEKIWDN